MDWSELTSGALPGKDREEQEAYLADKGFGISQAQAARIAEDILADKNVAPSSTPPEGGRPSGIRRGYGDPRV
ncbi:MAG TPA: hypothetical protein VFB35_00225 [Gaiellaceae bacterium]|nr:hypothetical protein [Gaiellaceae bacterium]